MTDFEREVIDRLGRIETKLDSDYRALHGNGKPGLIEHASEIDRRLAVLETEQQPTNGELGDRVAAIEQRHAATDKHHARRLEWLAILATAAGVLYSILKGE